MSSNLEEKNNHVKIYDSYIDNTNFIELCEKEIYKKEKIIYKKLFTKGGLLQLNTQSLSQLYRILLFFLKYPDHSTENIYHTSHY
jgi:hypothetical protein